MRCSQCNIDLGESENVCPLCGAKAENTPPTLPGVTEAPYPPHPQKQKQKKQRSLPNKYVLRVAAVLCLLCCISGNGLLFGLLAPLILLGVSIYHFVCGLLEKGELLHSAVAQLATLGVEALLLALLLLLRHSTNTTLFAAVCTLALLGILYALRTERFTAQMRALFRL